MTSPAKLKLIDVDLLLDIIRTSKETGPIQPPPDQNLLLSSKANDNVNTLRTQKPSLDNNARINTELINQSTFLDKFYNKNVDIPEIPQQPQTEFSEPPSILHHFGSQEKKKVEPILDRLKSNQSNLSYNENYEIIYNGNRIPDTNILDLIKTVVGRSKKIQKTPGLKIFIKMLKDLNVPLYSAGTPQSRRFLTTGEIDSALDPLTESIPTRGKKRKLSESDQPRRANTKRNTSRISKRTRKNVITEWI